ncbi:MAG TPA: hypothetical protein VFI20_09875 [Terracidiphilus sp.]|nr:hypothetical protein [Terracidiphilus sp.]
MLYRCCLSCTIALLLAPSAFLAQQLSNSSHKTSAEANDQHSGAHAILPEVNLDFEQGKPLQNVVASPVIATPIHCGPDGFALLQMLMPPDFRRTALYMVSKSRGRAISLSSIIGILKPQVVDVFDSDHFLGVLLYAVRTSVEDESPPSPGFFVALFKHNGNFQRLIELPQHNIYSRFALLPSHDLITLEFDPNNAVAKLILRDSDGEEVRALQLPDALEDVTSGAKQPSTLKPGTGYLRSDMETLGGSAAVGRARFTSAGSHILLWIPGVQSITELGDYSAFRQMKIKTPEGYAFDSMIPSTGLWIARFKRLGLSNTKPIDMRPESHNFVLYEVNPFDGHLQRRLNLGPHGSWLACANDGSLTVYKTDKEQHLIALTANIGR